MIPALKSNIRLPEARELLMRSVKIDLKNCYGIRSLQRELDFSSKPAYALYAPNGVMKSSLAETELAPIWWTV